MKLEFSWRIFGKKILNIKIFEHHEVWIELFHVDGWTDRHDEVNIRLSQFWESAYNTRQQNFTFFLAHEGKYQILIELLTLNWNM